MSCRRKAFGYMCRKAFHVMLLAGFLCHDVRRFFMSCFRKALCHEQALSHMLEGFSCHAGTRFFML